MNIKLKEVKVRLEDKYVKWFSDIDKEDVKLVGGKAANLGEMLKIGMPVPQGFVITSEAYSYFLEQTGLKEKIYKKLKDLDVEDTEQLEKTSNEIQKMIIGEELPEDLEGEIIEAYETLSIDKNTLQQASKNVASILKLSDSAFVAVRSSATAEDSTKASFAGQQETFLNVKGKTELIDKVRRCFASLFTARSIYYRVKKGFEHENVLNAVVIQEMVVSDKSGVIFSREPVTGKDEIVIESVFGLGEGIVSGRIKPDYYLVSRDLEILKEETADKKIAITRSSSGESQIIKLTEDRSKQQVLSVYEIKKLADYAIKLEEHYKKPQDIEFAIEGKEIFIVQTRPITTLGKEIKERKIEGKILLEGFGASPGTASGKVKRILDLKDLSKIKKGDILVTKMTNPDMVVSMQKSLAIITDEGGITSHAAIVSREMGIPCVVGTEKATKILQEEQLVTVDGFSGKIYEGKLEGIVSEKVEILPIVETKTKIKVMVDLPSYAKRAAKTNCKEVGLVRLEGIIAESGKHPYGFEKENKIEDYEKIIFSGLQEIGKYFDVLWIRTSDIRSDEYGNLKGAPKEKEGNPMLGMHGIRDSLKHKDILKAELKAISKVEKKIGILLPQVISVNEVREVKKIIEDLNLDISLGIMIETPASVEIIEDLCKEGIEFISFGTNDLTQYTLAVDRGNEQVQELFDEMNPAVLSQLKRVIEVCKKNNIETSICGQAGSKKEMVEFLVKLGIDSISVNADKAREISEFVKELEDKGLKAINLKKEARKEREEKHEEIRESKEQEIEREDKGEKRGYDIICDKCGKKDKVPFKPAEGREVYCKECFKEMRNKRKRGKEKKKEKETLTTPPQEQEQEEEREKEEEQKPKKEEEKKEEKASWEDVEFGFDVLSGQIGKKQEEKIEEEEIKREFEEEKEEAKEEENKIIKGKIKKEQVKKQEEIEESEPLQELEEMEKIAEEEVEKASEDIKGAEEVLDIF